MGLLMQASRAWAGCVLRHCIVIDIPDGQFLHVRGGFTVMYEHQLIC